MALALHGRGVATRLVLPAESAREAALAPGAELYGAAHRLDVVRQSCRAARHRARRRTMAGIVRCLPPAGPAAAAADWRRQGPCGRQARPRDRGSRTGQHSLLMVGPPGSGKSTLAQRFAGLLPEMSVDEALESAAVACGAASPSSAGGCGQPAARTTAPVQWRWSVAAPRLGRPAG